MRLPMLEQDLELAILESIPASVLAVDLENRILFFNRAVSRGLRISLDEWRGRSMLELAPLLVPHLSGPEVLSSRFEQKAVAEAPHESHDVEFHASGQVQHLREHSRALRNSSGEVLGRLFVYYDISREKAVDQMKSEFISVASHELRTPMTSIKGSIDLILSGFAGEYSAEAQELLDIAHKSCDRLIRLINDILDISKIEAGEIKLNPVRMDITEAVERAIRSVKPLADKTKVVLETRAPERLPEIEVDKDRIEQVITNLLSNAIKYSPEQGVVTVELEAQSDWLECGVRDRGCGISEQDLPKVFGKFQQVGEHRKGGTGLGLAISRALVQEHGGSMWVESKVNEGSRFVFRLPVSRASASSAGSH